MHDDKTRPPRILVVDDEPDICRMLGLCLKKRGLEVSCVESTAEAFELQQQMPYDLIISDIMMPGEDGISFLGRLHDEWRDLPVILMTGHAQLQMAINAIKKGAFDFVCKPFDLEHFWKIVERALKFSEMQRIQKNYQQELEETVARRTAELEMARAALESEAIQKRAFIGRLSHEMRTPMNGVTGCLELLAEEELSGASSSYLAMARESSANMVELINQLLDFNNMEISGPVTRGSDLLNPVQLVEELLQSVRPAFRTKGIDLSLTSESDLPQRIWCHKNALKRILEILLQNALKFTESGTVSLEMTTIFSPSGEESLQIRVTDTGQGIPMDMMEKIFEPFFQVDSLLTRRHEGVGLGLAIARQKAILLGGSIRAETVSSKGSCFNLTFKIIKP